MQRENVCCTWLYHQSARLIKSDSLFAVVVTGAAWSREIIFLHALLTLFLFSSLTRPQFLFVSVFLSTKRLIPVSLAAFFIVVFHTLSLCSSLWLEAHFTLPHLTFPLSSLPHPPLPTHTGCTILWPPESVYSCVACGMLNTLVKSALEGCFTHSSIPRSVG